MRTSGSTRRSPLLTVVAVAAWLAGLVASAVPGHAAAGGPEVVVTEVSGVITPVIADHLTELVERVEGDGAEALVVQLDTPGGLVTSMREIVQAFLNADVPVIVHVTPRGADAGSAGTFITLAAHVAAMSPATTIGAATPVDLEGGEVGDKIVNNAAAYAEAVAEARGRDVDFAVASVREGRSITVTEALAEGVVDLAADDLDDLLEEVDGRTVEVGSDERTLATADAVVVRADLSGARGLLQRLADPQLAFIFLSLGTLAIVYEVANPGLGAGGILGAVFLVLAMFSLAVLPVSYAGVALLLLAAGLFVAELFIPGIGVGAAGGTVALILGGLFLFQEPTGVGLSPWLVLPTALVTALLVAAAGVMVQRSRRRLSHVASDVLIGRVATVRAGREGPRVVLDGTFWRVRPAPGNAVPATGAPVVVVGRDNLDLIVAPEHDADHAARGAAAAGDDTAPATRPVPPAPVTEPDPTVPATRSDARRRQEEP